MTTLRPFALERYFARHEFTAPFHLCPSDAETWSIQDILDFEPGSRDQLLSLGLGYTESKGNPALRKAIADLYQTLKPDEILVHSGAQEAIFSFMSSVLQAGDHVIIHQPAYQSLSEVALANGCEVSSWHSRPENDWALDLNELKHLIRLNTRLIVINTPNNPTGYLMPQDTMAELINIARHHGLMIFSDEVYRWSEYNPSDRLPSIGDVYENGVSLGVMSKTFGLPGLRIGWIATHNQDIYKKMAQFKDYTTICNSAPSEWLATLALRHHDRLIHRNVNLMQQNLEHLKSFFQKFSNLFEVIPPKAGTIAFPKLLSKETADDFCNRLVTQSGILLLPGSVFGNYPQHLRIGYGRQNFPQLLERLTSNLDSVSGRSSEITRNKM